MNKILIGVNALLAICVAYLFYKTSGGSSASAEEKEEVKTEVADTAKPKVIQTPGIATPPTGKIAFINIDIINEESEEIKDLVAEAKRNRTNLEAGIERLSMEYQKKMEEYQISAKSGIAPQAEMTAKEKEIMAIEKEAQNRQLQIDNFTMSINEKNAAFQKNLKDFLVKWNNGRYDYILSYSDAVPTMLLGNATLDVTREVLDKVNIEYKAKKEQNKSGKK